MPGRCHRAREAEQFGLDLRQLLCGPGGAAYRILFDIGVDTNLNEEVVRVFRIWHGARADIDSLSRDSDSNTEDESASRHFRR
jgi:hypothetical protein